jgi:hypothetical protein
MRCVDTWIVLNVICVWIRDIEDHSPSFFMAGRYRSVQNTKTNYPENLSQFLRKEFLGKFEREMKRLVA